MHIVARIAFMLIYFPIFISYMHQHPHSNNHVNLKFKISFHEQLHTHTHTHTLVRRKFSFLKRIKFSNLPSRMPKLKFHFTNNKPRLLDKTLLFFLLIRNYSEIIYLGSHAKIKITIFHTFSLFPK